MLISDLQLRSIVREVLHESLLEDSTPDVVSVSDADKNKISSIFKKALNDVVSYINEPDSSTNSFRSRLNTKLKKLKLAKLTDSDISKFENKFKNIELKYSNSGPEENPNAVAWWDGINITLNINHIYDSNRRIQKSELTKTMYHELYHGMTSSIVKAVGEQKTIEQLEFDKASVVRAKEHRKAVQAAQGASAPWDIPSPGVYTRPAKSNASKVDTFYELFEEEFDVIIDKGALSSPRRWRAKIKKSKNKSLKLWVTRYLPGYNLKVRDARIREILENLADSEHYYVALKDLRRIFPRNTITSACNASFRDISKMEWWTVMFLSVLNCSSAADKAWDRVAVRLNNQNGAIDTTGTAVV